MIKKILLFTVIFTLILFSSFSQDIVTFNMDDLNYLTVHSALFPNDIRELVILLLNNRDESKKYDIFVSEKSLEVEFNRYRVGEWMYSGKLIYGLNPTMISVTYENFEILGVADDVVGERLKVAGTATADSDGIVFKNFIFSDNSPMAGIKTEAAIYSLDVTPLDGIQYLFAMNGYFKCNQEYYSVDVCEIFEVGKLPDGFDKYSFVPLMFCKWLSQLTNTF